MRHEVKKVFIAGGTGFLGYYSALKFLETGAEVTTIALSKEVEIGDWFPKEINLSYGNLFEMTQNEIEDMLRKDNYDTFIYALGPDDRVLPNAPSLDFFYEKLVVQAKKICSAAKAAGIKRCVIMNSYFSYFDRLYGGKLAKYHPYIKARGLQEKELSAMSESNAFDIMFLELPYIFGTMPNRKPLWRESFLSHFDRLPVIVFPFGGGTSTIDVSGVAEAVVAAAINGESTEKYQIGKTNILFKDLIKFMLKCSNDKRKYISLPAWLCGLGGLSIVRKNKREGKEGGLHYGKLMTQIQNKKFFINPNEYQSKLGFKELGFCGGKDVFESIKETMKECYPESF
ncbi:MAG: NAD(P)-dependent oxidoreductase [Clostridia bacterium]